MVSEEKLNVILILSPSIFQDLSLSWIFCNSNICPGIDFLVYILLVFSELPGSNYYCLVWCLLFFLENCPSLLLRIFPLFLSLSSSVISITCYPFCNCSAVVRYFTRCFFFFLCISVLEFSTDLSLGSLILSSSVSSLLISPHQRHSLFLFSVSSISLILSYNSHFSAYITHLILHIVHFFIRSLNMLIILNFDLLIPKSLSYLSLFLMVLMLALSFQIVGFLFCLLACLIIFC